MDFMFSKHKTSNTQLWTPCLSSHRLKRWKTASCDWSCSLSRFFVASRHECIAVVVCFFRERAETKLTAALFTCSNTHLTHIQSCRKEHLIMHLQHCNKSVLEPPWIIFYVLIFQFSLSGKRFCLFPCNFLWLQTESWELLRQICLCLNTEDRDRIISSTDCRADSVNTSRQQYCTSNYLIIPPSLPLNPSFPPKFPNHSCASTWKKELHRLQQTVSRYLQRVCASVC